MLKYIMHLKFLSILSGNSLFPKNILDKNQPFTLKSIHLYNFTSLPIYVSYLPPKHTISYFKYVTKGPLLQRCCHGHEKYLIVGLSLHKSKHALEIFH